jgi:ABC-2 type transport system ATP-binding protein
MLALQISKLSKTYSTGLKALDDVDLSIESGDFFALLGANGAGKTTLIGILTGLVNKTSGEALIFGKNITTQASESKRLVGVVPQEFNFNIFETVLDIVVSQAGYYGIPREKALEEAEKILKQLGLWEKRNEVSRALSGGMKRRLMIARALIHSPRLLILDEPTAGVDIELRREMWEYLAELNKSGVTIILTTHYLEEAELLCKNMAIIKSGKIVQQGPIRELLKGLENETYTIEIKDQITKLEIEGFKTKLIDQNSLEVSLNKNQNMNDFINSLTKQNIIVQNIQVKENRLEELFLSVVNKA